MRVIALVGVLSCVLVAATGLSACDVAVDPNPAGDSSARNVTTAAADSPAPAQTPAPDASSEPTPAATAAPAPIVVITATPTAPPTTSAAAWSGNRSCGVAESFLHEDAVLDANESNAIASGQDTRYPLADAAVYEMWSQRWYTLDAEATAICSNGVAPSYADVETAVAWMSTAIANHTADSMSVPTDAGWNAQWTTIYTTLIAQWNSLVVA
jgi:hypothetical protein